MIDYAAYIPVVNRPDLLQQCVERARPVRDNLTVIDNSPDGWVKPSDQYRLLRGPVPLSFTQSMNWEFKDCHDQGKKFCVHMHSDSIVPEGVFERLLDKAREIEASGERWGVIFTLYDILAVYNPEAGLAIGGFDTNFTAYFSDNDFYRRLRLAKYKTLESHIEVGHIGSQTIKSDPYLATVNDATFPLARAYYQAKWNGNPDHEKWVRPFNF